MLIEQAWIVNGKYYLDKDDARDASAKSTNPDMRAVILLNWGEEFYKLEKVKVE